MVLQVTLVSQDPQEQLAREDHQVTVVLQVWMVLLAPVVSMAQRVHVVHQDQKDDRVLKVHQDHQVHLVHQEQCKDSPTHNTQIKLSVDKIRGQAHTITEMMQMLMPRTKNQKSWLP